MEAPIVEAVGLRKRYDKHEVVCGVDFTVRARECFGLLGPNGAGKTTTIRMLTCFAPLDAGHLTVFGLAVNAANARAIKSRLGLAPQEENLDPDLTVAKNLAIYASYFGIGGAEARARVAELLAFAELEDRANDRIPTLSGGMKRRLILARALINRPSLLVLDEPTTGLDPQARHLVWERLRELKRNGVAMLLTTHYMEEAAQLCDRLVVMDHGRIIAEGTPAELIARARRPRRHRGRDRRRPGGTGARRGALPAARWPRRDRRGPRDPLSERRQRSARSPRRARGRAARAPPGDARGRVSHAHRPGAPRLMIGFVGGALCVWRRDMESWRKYYKASLVGALGEPILSLLAIGYGLGRFVADRSERKRARLRALSRPRHSRVGGDECRELRGDVRIVHPHDRAEDLRRDPRDADRHPRDRRRRRALGGVEGDALRNRGARWSRRRPDW